MTTVAMTHDPLARDSDALLAELEHLRPLAELGRLAATVAHEVRNPLAGISANAELVRESLRDPADIESVDMILAEVQRLSTLVGDLLHYSRERQARHESIDLLREARSVSELLRSDAQAASVSIDYHGDGVATGDAELSRQALLNVMRNAIQACQRGGHIEVTVVGTDIRIIDDGHGVPEALRDKLFEPFVTGRTRGLGLGAAVAKRCMERQGGSIALESSGEDGSVFRLQWAAD